LTSAPCRIPIELRAAGGVHPRVFRMARAISPVGLALLEGLPEEPDWLHGPMILRFVLPGGGETIECLARAREVVLGRDTPLERAALAALDLENVEPDAAKRIESYVEERLEEV
jgi:hypothetical protein